MTSPHAQPRRASAVSAAFLAVATFLPWMAVTTVADPSIDPHAVLGDLPPGVLDHGAGPIHIGAPQTYYADLGEIARYPLRVTNVGPTAVVVDLTWDTPPPGWDVWAFQPDGMSSLPDGNGNGIPDVSVDASASVSLSMAVIVPSTPVPQDGIVTHVVATADPTGDADTVDLRTNLAPYLAIDRSANPTVIDLLGSGGVEETTITLELDGQGTVVEHPGPKGADIMFVIDDTGSMGTWINEVKAQVDVITDAILQATSDVRFGLASYKDVPAIDIDHPLTFDVARFKTAVQGLIASGGADWPEDPDAALQLVANQSWRRSPVVDLVVLIGDAEAHNNNRLVGAAAWANTAMGIHTSTVACGDHAGTMYWFERTAIAGNGFFASLGNPNDLVDAILDGILGYIPWDSRAARDGDPNDAEPMVRDVLPPHIAYVPGTFVDPDTGNARPPSRIQPRPDGSTLLEWPVLLIEVNETWTVSFRVTSSLAGLVPTNVYGESRAWFLDWKDRPRVLYFPEVFVAVRSWPPETTLGVGVPSVSGSPPFVTSATPLWFVAQDYSGTGIEGTEFRVDGGPWVDITGGGPFTLFPEGEHLVEWFSRDRVGNVEEPRSAVFLVDNTPPETVFLVGDPKYVSGWTYITPVTPLYLFATDGGVTPVGVGRIDYRVDAGPWRRYVSSFLLAVEGLHIVDFRASDRLGNAELGHTATIYVDASGPTITFSVGSPSYVAVETSLTSRTPIALAAEDVGTPPVGLEMLEYRVGFGTWSAWTPYAAPFVLSPEGRHTLEIRARDRLGNEGLASTAFIVDDTPPTTSWFVGNPKVIDGATFVTVDSPLTLSALDGGPLPVGVDRIEYRVDDGPWAAYGGAFRLEGEGLHSVEFRAFDRLGNVEDVTSLVLVVDDSPPAIALAVGTPRHVSADTWITSTSPLDGSAVDEGPIPVGLSSFEYREWYRSWSLWTPYTGPLFLSGEGLHRLEFRASDRLGNEVLTAYTFLVDNTPPVLSLDVGSPSLSGDELFVTSGTPFTLLAEDPGPSPVGLASVEYRLGDDSWRPYASPFVITGTDGLHVTEYRAVDLLGHLEDGSTRVVLDNTPPETRLTMALAPPSGEVTLSLAAEDAGSGVKFTESRVGEGRWWPYGAPIRLGGGSHLVHYRSTDRLGNVEPERLYEIVLPEPGPRVFANWTPSVAFAFSVVLLIAAAESARRARRRGGVPGDVAKTMGIAAPFVIGECGTGLLSIYLPILRMPPLFGWAAAFVVLILAFGGVIIWLRARAVRPPPPKDEVPRPSQS